MGVLPASIFSSTLYLPYTLGLPFNAFIMLILMICRIHATYMLICNQHANRHDFANWTRAQGKNNEGASCRSMQCQVQELAWRRV
jgi:cell division protein FtsL